MSNKVKTFVKQSVVPKLRFPEFQDAGDWEVKPLSKICNVNPPSTKLPESFFYIDLGSVADGYLIAQKIIKKQDAPSRAQRLLKTEDIIFQIVRPYQRNNFFCNFNKENHYVASTGYAQLRAFESSRFLYHAIHTNDFVNIVISKCTGSNYPAINSSDLANIKLSIPDANEQQKISDCLSSIDELIIAESKKIDALKTYKKGLMQQLFPAEGETLPKLRFPEFQAAPDWEEKTLQELCSLQAGKFITASEIYEKKQKDLYPCYGGNGLRGFVKNYTHNGTYPLIGRQGALCGNINISEGSFYATEHAVVVTAKKGVNVNWLFYQLVRLNLNQYATGQAQPGLSITVLDKVCSTIPNSLIEQRKIADCLSSIDELITAESKKLDLLKAHKKGLLQQLFPSLESQEQGDSQCH